MAVGPFHVIPRWSSSEMTAKAEVPVSEQHPDGEANIAARSVCSYELRDGANGIVALFYDADLAYRTADALNAGRV